MGIAQPARRSVRASAGVNGAARLALIGLACAVLLAACGSSSGASASGSSGPGGTEARLVSYSECMRAHGVSGFPDPSTSQNGDNGFGIDGYNFNLPSTINAQSPAYESASALCGKRVGVGPSSGGGHALPAALKQRLLKLAECMRTHGVPNYPDPKFSGGGVSQGFDARSGVGPNSPAFQRAVKDCRPAH
jgi:hypothetical protein